MDRIINFLVNKRKINAVVSLAALSLFSLFLFQIEFENSLESFIAKDDPEMLFYQQFKSEFGEDQILVLAIPMVDVFTSERIAQLEKISSTLEQLPEVVKVRSLATVQDVVGDDETFVVSDFIDTFRASDNVADLKRHTLRNPIYQKVFFSDDGTVASLLIEADVEAEGDRYLAIVSAIDDLMSEMSIDQYYLAGDPVVELQLTNDMWHDLKTFIPWTAVVLAIFLILCFRSVGAMLIGLLIVTLCTGFLLGLIGALGITMNVVTVGLPSLIMCIAIMDSVHLLSSYRLTLGKGLDRVAAVGESLRQNLLPCLMTSLTSAAGFASICTTEIVPNREFGFLAAASTLAAYPICLLVMPFLMAQITIKQPAANSGRNTALNQFNKAIGPIYRNRVVLVFAMAVIAALSFQQMSKINIETVFLNFMNESSGIKQSTNYIQDNLGGVSPLEISITSPHEEGILDPDVLKQIEAFQVFLDELPTIDKTLSIVEYVKEMNQAVNNEDPGQYALPDSADLIAQYIFTYSLSGRDNDLDDLVDYNYQIARISGRMSQATSEELQQTLKIVQDYIDRHFTDELSVVMTSYSVIQTSMIGKLISGQVNGIAIALIVMFTAFVFVTRSLLIAALCMIPNLLPIIAFVGLMAYLGFSLNAGTAMIACIIFGLVVDDTLHFLYHHRESAAPGIPVQSVIDTVLNKVGPALIYSSLILAAGFALLMLGDSFFTYCFGLLSAFSILFAMACNVLIMPYFVYHFRCFQFEDRQREQAVTC